MIWLGKGHDKLIPEDIGRSDSYWTAEVNLIVPKKDELIHYEFSASRQALYSLLQFAKILIPCFQITRKVTTKLCFHLKEQQMVSFWKAFDKLHNSQCCDELQVSIQKYQTQYYVSMSMEYSVSKLPKIEAISKLATENGSKLEIKSITEASLYERVWNCLNHFFEQSTFDFETLQKLDEQCIMMMKNCEDHLLMKDKDQLYFERLMISEIQDLLSDFFHLIQFRTVHCYSLRDTLAKKVLPQPILLEGTESLQEAFAATLAQTKTGRQLVKTNPIQRFEK